jgi:hypothetical protein
LVGPDWLDIIGWISLVGYHWLDIIGWILLIGYHWLDIIGCMGLPYVIEGYATLSVLMTRVSGVGTWKCKRGHPSSMSQQSPETQKFYEKMIFVVFWVIFTKRCFWQT